MGTIKLYYRSGTDIDIARSWLSPRAFGEPSDAASRLSELDRQASFARAEVICSSADQPALSSTRSTPSRHSRAQTQLRQ